MARINAKHKPLYTSKKRYVYEKGGRGSGKSFAITDYALRITYDNNRVILFLRYTMVAASISIVPEFEKAMERENAREHFDISGSEITNKLTGSKIIFKGVKTSSLNQTANLKSIQGLTDVIYDEFEEHPDQETFDKLDESVRETSAANRIILSSNALHKQSWQYKQFWSPEGLYYPMTEHITTNYFDNIKNVSDSWLTKVERVKETNIKKYNRDFLGLDYDDIDGALWKWELLEKNRTNEAPDLVRIVVAIDPAVTSKEDSDETGIVVSGVDHTGRCYVLDDISGKYTPQEWGLRAIGAYRKWNADMVVAEVNQGGDMVRTIIKNIDPRTPYKDVRAARGKSNRAEPVVALYQEGQVYHVGHFPELEMQMTSWIPYEGKSPDRVDALVWAIHELTQNSNHNWVIA